MSDLYLPLHLSVRDGVLSCRCQHNKVTPSGTYERSLSWSVCQYEECNKHGAGIANNPDGQLACSTGLNYCLATYDYDARVKKLEESSAHSGKVPTTDEDKRQMSENPFGFFPTHFDTYVHLCGIQRIPCV